MLSRIRMPLLLALVAALLVAVGYWNIRPESFMREPVASDAEQPTGTVVAVGLTVVGGVVVADAG